MRQLTIYQPCWDSNLANKIIVSCDDKYIAWELDNPSPEYRGVGSYMQVDTINNTRDIDKAVEIFLESIENNAPIVHNNTKHILRFVRDFLGSNAQWDGVQNYADKHYRQAYVVFAENVWCRGVAYCTGTTHLTLYIDQMTVGSSVHKVTTEDNRADERIGSRNKLIENVDTSTYNYHYSMINTMLRDTHYYEYPTTNTAVSLTTQLRLQELTLESNQVITINTPIMETTKTGVIFANTGDHNRDTIVGYHSKPEPIVRDKTKYRVDLVGFRRNERAKSLLQTDEGYTARFTIGFEVEKTELHARSVKEYPLFCGFERDGSCGYEAVTHILPLIPASTWRNKVFSMFYEAEKIIDDNYSPSNDSCGGHITIGIKGMRGVEIMRLVRGNSAILLAMFRKRLTNRYCCVNANMIDWWEGDEGGSQRSKKARMAINGTRESNSDSTRYAVALVKEFTSEEGVLEFRLPSAVRSVKQMINRYELMYEIVNFSVNKPKASFDSFIKHITPLLERMYEGATYRMNETIRLAYAFNKMMKTGKINNSIRPFLDPRGQQVHFYDDSAMEWYTENEVSTSFRLS